MNFETLKAICTSFPCVTSDFPFDQETIVFRVEGKIFALSNVLSRPLKVNLKCEPGLSRDLRANRPEIVPGYHMNKEHWNTVDLEGTLDDEFVRNLVRMSHDLIVDKLPKAARERVRGSIAPK